MRYADIHVFVAEKMKSDKQLSQAMANSTHALRESFDDYVKEWQQKGRKETNGISGKDGINIEQVEVVDSSGPKRKILGYGTSVAFD